MISDDRVGGLAKSQRADKELDALLALFLSEAFFF